MTFVEAIKANREELTRQWKERKGDLLEALKNLKTEISKIEQQVNEPIPDCGLYEIYLGLSYTFESQFEKALRAYNGLESVKLRAKFIEDLNRAVSESK